MKRRIHNAFLLGPVASLGGAPLVHSWWGFLFFQCIAIAMAVAVVAEPPSGYSYSRPSGGGGGFSGGFSGGLSGGGGGYTAVSSGYSTSEGQNVDPQLLEQVRQILLKEEQSSSASSFSSGGGLSSSYGAPSSQYGAPSSSYGAPSYSSGRVVGIDLEGIKQAIQVVYFFHKWVAVGLFYEVGKL